MTVYSADIPVREGHVVVFDGVGYKVTRRTGDDTFAVRETGDLADDAETERHIDWFADQASQAEVIVIDRRGANAE